MNGTHASVQSTPHIGLGTSFLLLVPYPIIFTSDPSKPSNRTSHKDFSVQFGAIFFQASSPYLSTVHSFTNVAFIAIVLSSSNRLSDAKGI